MSKVNTKKKDVVYIYVEGGNIQCVRCTTPIKSIIVDYDRKGDCPVVISQEDEADEMTRDEIAKALAYWSKKRSEYGDEPFDWKDF